MHAIPVPTRITIDFREAIAPSHGWIIGATPGAPRRIELVAVTSADADRGDVRPRVSWTPAPPVEPFAGQAPLAVGDCCCPDFCDLDHANE